MSLIGVFDSGVGGLSVLAALHAELPHECFVYFADTAFAPYGERGDDYVIERSRSKNGTFSVIGTTGPGATVFNDTNLPSNTIYYYRIRAANATGQSAPSIRAAARTNP